MFAANSWRIWIISLSGNPLLGRIVNSDLLQVIGRFL